MRVGVPNACHMLKHIFQTCSFLQAELQHTLEESQGALTAAQEALSVKELQLKELQSQKAVELDMVSKEAHEAQRLSLQAEINTLTACLADLTRKHEKTCTEVSHYVCVVCESVRNATMGLSVCPSTFIYSVGIL